MVKIRKNIVPKRLADKVTYGGTNTKTYIIFHETANENEGANADSHGRLQVNGNSRQASWHYSVDDKEVVQSFSDNDQCWAAGNLHYNKHGIQVEICVNSDGDFKKAVENASALGRKLMKKHNISPKHVLQHYDASMKNCPRYLRSGDKGITWVQFKESLTSGESVATTPTPSKPKASKTNNNSIVDYLNNKGINSSYSNRANLAVQYGIKNYKGTASQNTVLLSKMRAREITTSTSTKKGDMRTSSIVTYLNSIGTNSSYTNRATLAKQHGISNYKGTAAQNISLLAKLRSGASTPSKPIGDLKTESVVDYLKSIKVNSSYANRKKLAAKHGIKNYKGTASQNAQLLNTLRK